MSYKNNWPAGLDPRKDTSNGMYGAYVPGSTLWERSYLQYYPPVMKNRKLDKFRQKLRTSSEEYGYYWAKAASPQGTPFHFKPKTPSHDHPNYESKANTMKMQTPERSFSEPVYYPNEAQEKADQFWEKIKPTDDHLDRNNNWSDPPPKLPQITDVDRAFIPRLKEGEINVDGKSIKLPDIKQISIQLHMADSSVVNLKTIPYRPYQFHN